jgi:hypothetical protein
LIPNRQQQYLEKAQQKNVSLDDVTVTTRAASPNGDGILAVVELSVGYIVTADVETLLVMEVDRELLANNVSVVTGSFVLEIYVESFVEAVVSIEIPSVVEPLGTA